MTGSDQLPLLLVQLVPNEQFQTDIVICSPISDVPQPLYAYKWCSGWKHPVCIHSRLTRVRLPCPVIPKTLENFSAWRSAPTPDSSLVSLGKTLFWNRQSLYDGQAAGPSSMPVAVNQTD